MEGEGEKVIFSSLPVDCLIFVVLGYCKLKSVHEVVVWNCLEQLRKRQRDEAFQAQEEPSPAWLKKMHNQDVITTIWRVKRAFERKKI